MSVLATSPSLSFPFQIEAGLIVFTPDGQAQFGWRDLVTGLFHSEADGQAILNAVGAVEFISDITH
ncbi:hypothetical protein [Caballeronia sp. 15711]|uniref:hypothetical protein n=1 Tax=Caballeronia sp. 15711 TaxID=3391029 RepID=UPI0039E220B4